MICPNCGSSEIRVIDKREFNDSSIRRKRECTDCYTRWWTIETISQTIRKKGDPFESEPVSDTGGPHYRVR